MPISEYENNLTGAKWKGMFVPALRKVRSQLKGKFELHANAHIPVSGKNRGIQIVWFLYFTYRFILNVNRGIENQHTGVLRENITARSC